MKRKMDQNSKHSVDVHEPPPIRNNLPAMWDLVIADMTESKEQSPLMDIVLTEMAARDAFGRQKHGGPLQPFNGRDPLWDAYQEGLDFVVYLAQAVYEHSNNYALRALYRNTQILVIELRRVIFEKEGK
jgi:hypothetical protein